MAMQYLFRKPVFPVICDIHGELIVAFSFDDFANKLSAFQLKENHLYTTIDAKGEGWFLNIEPLVISPLTIKKHWTKKGLITLYNNSKNSKVGHDIYAERSISNKTIEVVFSEIVDRLQSL